jgi:hypothetical protein
MGCQDHWPLGEALAKPGHPMIERGTPKWRMAAEGLLADRLADVVADFAQLAHRDFFQTFPVAI